MDVTGYKMSLKVSNNYLTFCLVYLCYLKCYPTLSGANRTVYAPEPFDVGRVLQAEVCSNGRKVTVTSSGPINPG